MQLAGMASNRGRNLMHIADRAPGGAEFAVILSNTEGAPILEVASERGIPTEVVVQGADESREAHEARVREQLREYNFELVAMDGYMRILTETFVENLPTILNIHPSLLPSFPGMDAHEQVLRAGVRLSGCTVHVVDETVDGGPIVTQEPVPVFESDDITTLKQRTLYEGEYIAYPRAIQWFAQGRVEVDGGTVTVEGDTTGAFPARRVISNDHWADLRYGENPHQDATLYADAACTEASVVHAEQLNEGAKALSYNNYNDADGALDLIKEFDDPAAAVIKHTNPAGCATAETLATAYKSALATDPMSAFGGIVALNRTCDAITAEAITDSFKEVVVAPAYTDSALDVLCTKENLRVLRTGSLDDRSESLTEKPLTGGRLVQERDLQPVTHQDLEFVSEREPTEQEVASMLFAWKVIKHVKSNAILFTDGTETVGVGMGQVSRVDAVHLAAMKAEQHAEGKDSAGAVMASDAFFPFPDAIEVAAEADISAVVQPGGSVNDEDVIEAVDEYGMAMAFTGQRAFRHD
jgi:phosphoribosylaminoimidazolecarboxamide formyltransferase/IMP cyclohydrolase